MLGKRIIAKSAMDITGDETCFQTVYPNKHREWIYTLDQLAIHQLAIHPIFLHTKAAVEMGERDK